jgi:hypothetical protein
VKIWLRDNANPIVVALERGAWISGAPPPSPGITVKAPLGVVGVITTASPGRHSE